MNWSKTKTIFIICFFLLDLFLVYQLIMRQKSAQNQVNNFTQSSFTQYVKTNKIKINTSLPDINQSLTFLSGAYQDFGDKSDDNLVNALNGLAGPTKKPIQTFTISNQSTVLRSTFNQAVPVPETQADQQAFLKQYIYNGDNYRFWTYNKDQGVYKFIQTYNGHPIFSVINGKLNTLDVTLSKDGKSVQGYVQSYINIKKEQATKLGVQPMDAIQQLWEKNKLPIIDKPVVEQMDLGYINLSENNDQTQTLAYLPAWYIEVKTTQNIKHYFVTGIYGRIQSIDGEE